MSRIVYVNGRYLAYQQAQVHVEDRGFQFADAVYEVIEVRASQLIDSSRHLKRLQRSLSELQIAMPMKKRSLHHIISQVVVRNRVQNGLVYLQISRGVAPRDFLYPDPPVQPSLVCLARAHRSHTLARSGDKGISVITLPESRWQRCDIKTVMLLPACIAKQTAHVQGATEAWFVDPEGLITEGASSNAWIVEDAGCLVTRSLGQNLLPGVTREVLLGLIDRLKIGIVERPFSVSQAKSAKEAFITSATNTVMPVIRIDGCAVGNGEPGPLTLKLRAIYQERAQSPDN